MTPEEMIAVKIACQGRDPVGLAELNLAQEIAEALTAAKREGLEAAAKIVRGEVYKQRCRTWSFWGGNRSEDSEIVKFADDASAAISAHITELESDEMTEAERNKVWEWLRTAHGAARKIRISKMRGENTLYSAEIGWLCEIEEDIRAWLYPSKPTELESEK